MSSIPEIFDSTKTAIQNRITHPILGSFIIFWFVFNWEAVLFVTFGDEAMLYKLKWVNENHKDLMQNFLYPLGCSIAASTIVPFLSLYLKLFTNKIHLLGLNIDISFKRAVKAINESFSDDEHTQVNKLKMELESINGELEFAESRLKNELNIKEKELNAKKEQYNSELASLKDRFNMFTPLLIETEISPDLLNKQLNFKEVCKLNILTSLYRCKNKYLTIAEIQANDGNLDANLLSEILNEFNMRSITECDGNNLGEPSTFVYLQDEGALEIIHLKAKVISQELKLGYNTNLPNIL
ncbi:hypothetical protein L1D51_20840 [Pseudoalteromonas shioyasakiensis]|uniref:hypothetical protein n=1 Tax=Pseudoalteromonas shioyasakiensis TaxID=1190813 RepID=UPI001EFD6D6E|nr:hypothetical protein [Pseudoalteromonas shioyasakiensis]MCG9736409.1 hypothetical protein [Pseudoalteromonas shioyasakiensis]